MVGGTFFFAEGALNARHDLNFIFSQGKMLREFYINVNLNTLMS